VAARASRAAGHPRSMRGFEGVAFSSTSRATPSPA